MRNKLLTISVVVNLFLLSSVTFLLLRNNESQVRNIVVKDLEVLDKIYEDLSTSNLQLDIDNSGGDFAFLNKLLKTSGIDEQITSVEDLADIEMIYKRSVIAKPIVFIFIEVGVSNDLITKAIDEIVSLEGIGNVEYVDEETAYYEYLSFLISNKDDTQSDLLLDYVKKLLPSSIEVYGEDFDDIETICDNVLELFEDQEVMTVKCIDKLNFN